MTREELRRLIYTELLEDPDNPQYWGIDEVNEKINKAIYQYSKDTGAYKYRDTFNTTSGEDTYNLPAYTIDINFIAVKSASDSSPTKIERIYWKDIPLTSTNGRPTKYVFLPSDLSVEGGERLPSILLYPTPDDTYEVMYDIIRSASFPTDDNDILEIPDMYKYAIVYYTTYLLHLKSIDEASQKKAAGYLELYYMEIRDLINQFSEGYQVRAYNDYI